MDTIPQSPFGDSSLYQREPSFNFMTLRFLREVPQSGGGLPKSIRNSYCNPPVIMTQASDDSPLRKGGTILLT